MNLSKLNEVLIYNDYYHVYQPIINLKTQSIIGYEMFFRSKQFNSPLQAFQLAKREKLLYEFETRLLWNGILHFFQSEDLSFKKKIFVNLFPSTITHPKFIAFIKNFISLLNVSANQIVIEVNEAEKIQDFELLKSRINYLRFMGFSIAIDDINKTITEVKKILELNIDFIKADIRYKSNFKFKDQKRILIKSFLKICKEDVHMVVEGIENKDDFELVKKLGVEYGQGYLFRKPQKLKI
ncbi:MAG: EAL domain-containing protein [Bacillaceae bacterium]|nr:EAL domain-containing protein [Bacillaceae bacterium]